MVMVPARRAAATSEAAAARARPRIRWNIRSLRKVWAPGRDGLHCKTAGRTLSFDANPKAVVFYSDRASPSRWREAAGASTAAVGPLGRLPCGARASKAAAELALSPACAGLRSSNSPRRPSLREGNLRDAPLLGAAEARRQPPATASARTGESFDERLGGVRKGVAGRRAQRLCGAEERSGGRLPRRSRGRRGLSRAPLRRSRKRASSAAALEREHRRAVPRSGTAAVEAEPAARPRLCALRPLGRSVTPPPR